MTSIAASRTTAPTAGQSHEGPESALAAALWQSCRAEAEAMWTEIQRRLRPDETRKAAFIEQMTRNLLNKTTRKRRSQILRQLSEAPQGPGHGHA